MGNHKLQKLIYQDCKELIDLAKDVGATASQLLEEFNSHDIKLFDLPRYQRIFLFGEKLLN